MSAVNGGKDIKCYICTRHRYKKPDHKPFVLQIVFLYCRNNRAVQEIDGSGIRRPRKEAIISVYNLQHENYTWLNVEITYNIYRYFIIIPMSMSYA